MDGLQGKDMDTAGEGRMLTDNGAEKRQRAGHGQMDYTKNYSREATVIMDVADLRDPRAEDIIKAVNGRIGEGKILAVRPRQGKEYEITLTNKDECENLDEGLTIKGKLCGIRQLQVRECVVSFIHLPAYIRDSEIVEQLKKWGVAPASAIRRRMYPGTEIADGTRYLRVKFPKEVKSLPYSTKFETEEGSQYFRIMHDRQVKTCRLCMNPGHVFKDCPDFKCFQCGEQGHFARNCDAVKCPDCRKVMVRCECYIEELDEIQNTGSMDVGGQLLKETELENVGEAEKGNGGNKETNGENQEEMEEDEEEGEREEEKEASLGIEQETLEEKNGKTEINEKRTNEMSMTTMHETEQICSKDQGENAWLNVEFDQLKVVNVPPKIPRSKEKENVGKNKLKNQSKEGFLLRYDKIPNLKLVLKKQNIRRMNLEKKRKVIEKYL